MPFPTPDPDKKLVQMNVGIPWSLSVMIDQVAAKRSITKSELVRDLLHDAIVATPEMIEITRREARPPK